MYSIQKRMYKLPTFTDPLREIDAASVKEYASTARRAASNDFVQEACESWNWRNHRPSASSASMTIHLIRSSATAPSSHHRRPASDPKIQPSSRRMPSPWVKPWKEVDALFMNKDITVAWPSTRLVVTTAGYTKTSLSTCSTKPAPIKVYKVAGIYQSGTGDWPAGQMANIARHAPNKSAFPSCPAACSCREKNWPASFGPELHWRRLLSACAAPAPWLAIRIGRGPFVVRSLFAVCRWMWEFFDKRSTPNE